MTPRPTTLLSACALFALFLALPSAVSAAATIRIEQKSDIDAVGKWTLAKPNQETLERTDKALDLPDSQPGHYTLFMEPPQGTNTSIVVTKNGVPVETVSHPQVSFDVADGESVTIAITLSLTNFGRIGVNSEPAHMPFLLRGPNNLEREGVTPQTFERMPTGNYSVQYKPQGCPLPPGKSGVLKKEGAVYFSFELKCDAFVPAEVDEEPTHVTTEVKGSTVMFTDVPNEAWFAAFVRTVAKRGILTGYRSSTGESTGEFGPQNPVTIAELAKISHEMAGVDELEISVPPRNSTALGKWFTKYVSSAEERGWTIYQDPNMDLVRPATRGEVLITLLQVLDVPLTWQKGKTFTDVTLSTPYAHAIETAAAAGLVSGATDATGEFTGEFHPLDPITRAELAKILITIQEKYQQEPEEE
jgi:hypothetical protein